MDYLVDEDDICCACCLLKTPSPSQCCDVCNPKLAQDLFSPMDSPKKPPPMPRRAKLALPPDLLPSEYSALMSRLKSWREDVAEREWGPFFPLGGLGIIADSQIERVVLLAHSGMLPDTERLKHQLDWCYHHEYGAEVIAIVHELYLINIPPSIHDAPTTPSQSTLGGSSEPPAKKTTKTYKCRACGGTGHNGA
jgi:hypothetical protein